MQQSPQTLLAHERLDAYSVPVELAEQAHSLARQLPRSKGQLGDQLSRASESIMLCIAEGSGVAWHSAEQKRYFRAARASALECAAILDVCRLRGVGRQEQRGCAKQLIIRLVQMLTKLCR